MMAVVDKHTAAEHRMAVAVGRLLRCFVDNLECEAQFSIIQFIPRNKLQTYV